MHDSHKLCKGRRETSFVGKGRLLFNRGGLYQYENNFPSLRSVIANETKDISHRCGLRRQRETHPLYESWLVDIASKNIVNVLFLLVAAC